MSGIDRVDFSKSVAAEHHMLGQQPSTSFLFDNGQAITVFHRALSKDESAYIRILAANIQTKHAIKSTIASVGSRLNEAKESAKNLKDIMKVAKEQMERIKEMK